MYYCPHKYPLISVQTQFPLNQLIEAVKQYNVNANRRVTFEYILLKDVNDSLHDADELAKLIKPVFAYVNLIPYNETDNLGFKRSSAMQIMKFYDILKKNRVNVTIRREFGGNISAACGQLRSKEEIK